MAVRLRKALFLVTLICGTVYVSVVEGSCGYQSCPKSKPGHLNVHLVAHSHDDVGWLKTVDQYYHGTNLHIDPSGVQYILDSVMVELKKNPNRKFIYVETAFFWRWWRNQDEDLKAQVVKFVENGQLEFISGGWSLNDEGCTHYNALIDQMSLGMRFLNDTFGDCATPKIAWQIDTFGHSREQGYLFTQMGFDAFFIGRMDYQYKSHLRWNQEMEMIWSTSPNNFGKLGWLFTSVLYNYYQPPEGYCFDQLCKDDPIIDDPTDPEYNVIEKVERFIRIAHWWEDPYGTNNVLMTMGSDFHYMNANMWFKNLDKLIKHVNAYDYGNDTEEITKVNVMYSSPSCYLQEVHKTKKSFPVLYDDFFPYSNDPYGFWNGYFTSRPNFKYLIHNANNFLQVCKQLAVSAFQGRPEMSYILDKVFQLSEPLAIVQHHDAITGTAKQHVTDDYSFRLSVGLTNCEHVVNLALNKIQPRNVPIKYQFCRQLNISSCFPTEMMTDFTVTIYNPLARKLQNTYVRVPVVSPYWAVFGSQGEILSQVIEIPEPVRKIPGREGKATYEIVVRLDEVQALGMENVRVTAMIDKKKQTYQVEQPPIESFKNKMGIEIVIDRTTGLLVSVSRGSVTLPLKQNFYYYNAMAGNNTEFRWRASGAYIFRPNTTESDNYKPHPVNIEKIEVKVYRGVHVTEIHQVFNTWVSQVIRLYEYSELVEFEWLVGSIPVDDGVGKEIVTKYTSNLSSNGTFYTDSNGRQFVKRQRDHRHYPFYEYEKVAQNYYPVTSRIAITGDSKPFPQTTGPSIVIFNDRSQGGTSMVDGEIELMVHRRLLYDDDFGVGEALNEVAYGTGLVARGKHWLFLCGEGTGVPFSLHRQIGQEIFLSKIYAISSPSSTPLYPQTTIISNLASVLPPNIHLLTVEPLPNNQIIIRLEHYYELNEDPFYSQPVTLSIQVILSSLPFVKSLRETSLGGNSFIEDVHRFDWSSNENTTASYPNDNFVPPPGTIVLWPMEIKTFILEIIT